jgi:very-short-patch-repair endonuclease
MINSNYKVSPPVSGGVPAKGGGGGKAKANEKRNVYYYYLKTIRKKLRNNLTSAEARLWSLIKNKQLHGRKFRRQYSIGNYIVDFYCPKEHLAIELDGNDHFHPESLDRDMARDLELSQKGIRVLRFENKWIWEDPEWLLNQVIKNFGPPRPPSASTPPQEEGRL